MWIDEVWLGNFRAWIKKFNLHRLNQNKTGICARQKLFTAIFRWPHIFLAPGLFIMNLIKVGVHSTHCVSLSRVCALGEENECYVLAKWSNQNVVLIYSFFILSVNRSLLLKKDTLYRIREKRYGRTGLVTMQQKWSSVHGETKYNFSPSGV